jgi:phosphotransferase system  glucose/maltose/N-acetylglucosamine-specific IIC component
MSWTPFAFLPVFIAITAARHFKCNPFIAVLCCCALISPDWAALAGRIAGGEHQFPLLPAFENGVYLLGFAAAVPGVGALLV